MKPIPILPVKYGVIVIGYIAAGRIEPRAFLERINREFAIDPPYTDPLKVRYHPSVILPSQMERITWPDKQIRPIEVTEMYP